MLSLPCSAVLAGGMASCRRRCQQSHDRLRFEDPLVVPANVIILPPVQGDVSESQFGEFVARLSEPPDVTYCHGGAVVSAWPGCGDGARRFVLGTEVPRPTQERIPGPHTIVHMFGPAIFCR